jgi:hypothetical protein
LSPLRSIVAAIRGLARAPFGLAQPAATWIAIAESNKCA